MVWEVLITLRNYRKDMHAACIGFFLQSANIIFPISNVPHYSWQIWGFMSTLQNITFPSFTVELSVFVFLFVTFSFLFCWNDDLAYIIQFVYVLECKNWTVFRNYYNPVFICMCFITFTTDWYMLSGVKENSIPDILLVH